jgi:uncharacterized DUF497 family protein
MRGSGDYALEEKQKNRQSACAMILWDEKKQHKLRRERNISFDEIAALILKKDYLDILEHPARPNQQIFAVLLNGYVHAVPFVIDEQGNVVLKTAFPSRKLHKKYMRVKP